MGIFIKLANLLYVWLEGLEIGVLGFIKSRRTREDMVLLDPTCNINEKQKEYVVEKIAYVLMILTVGGFLTVGMWISTKNSSLIEDNKLSRNEFGQGDKDVNLVALIDEETVELSFTLKERKYTKEELEELYIQFLINLEKSILGKNESLEKIEYDVNLVKEIKDYPFEIEWTTDCEYIDYSGELLKDELEKTVMTELTAFIYADGFERYQRFGCNVYSRKEPHDTVKVLEEELRKIEEENRYTDNFTLPQNIGTKEIIWSGISSKKPLIYLLLTPCIAIAIWFCKDRDLHKLVEKREDQMRRDYSEIVSKLSLYIGAGMTVGNAWAQVAQDYLKRNEKSDNLKKDNRRYAYEQMILSVREINSGSTLYEAYERFGTRCQVSCYSKLAALLTQNIRKGSSDIAGILNEEAMEAFEERKHTAARLGEQASTKLLIPMMMLLMIVMVVIVVPAFMNQMI